MAFKVNERVGDTWLCRGETQTYGGAVSLLRELRAETPETVDPTRQGEPEFEIKAVFSQPVNDGRAASTRDPFFPPDPPAPSLRKLARSMFHTLQVVVAIFLALLALAIVLPKACTSTDSTGRVQYNHL